MNTYIQNKFNEVEDKLSDKITKDIQRAMKDYGDNYNTFKDQMTTQLTIATERCTQQTTALQSQIPTLVNDKFTLIK